MFKSVRNTAKKYGAKLSQYSTKAAVAVSSLVPVAAMATEPEDPILTAFTELGSKVGIYGAALITLAIVGIGFAIGIKYLKKAPRAA